MYHYNTRKKDCMKLYKLKISFFVLTAAIISVSSCTKLNQNLTSSLPTTQANTFSNLFLQSAYNDIGVVYEDPSNVGQLEELTGDEAFIPIRGTDWFDGGYHVQLHLHNWTRQSVPLLETEFIALNKMNYDATTVLGTNGTPDQLAQAHFIRSLALYQLLDLFGQYPIRQPGENLLLPSKVYSGDSAVQFIISELTAAIPNLNTSNGVTLASPDAARMLLMKVYLNRGAFNSRANPTFADADMQQVITLGNAIMANPKYAFEKNYFDIFNPTNANTTEAIFSLPNSQSANTGSGFYPNIQNQWYATLNYNSYTPLNPQAGWNGFATMGEFYNTFGVNGLTPTQTMADTGLDQRLGNKPYPVVTAGSGIRPGILINQQFNEDSVKEKDKIGNLLFFTNASEVPPTIDVSLLPTIETSGYRIVKYVPDLTNPNGAAKSYQVPANYFILLRYADVLLMVAEAKMRAAAPDNGGALTLVNKIRVARNAAPLNTMALVNSGNVYDPNTLLAERGRELYWENIRRTDLIRFGVWKIAWRLKPADAGNFYIFPIPQDDLNSNPNLIPNLQGTNY
jgi:starch-binding outer membrane protein, SusD/RagB family